MAEKATTTSLLDSLKMILMETLVLEIATYIYQWEELLIISVLMIVLLTMVMYLRMLISVMSREPGVMFTSATVWTQERLSDI